MAGLIGGGMVNSGHAMANSGLIRAHVSFDPNDYPSPLAFYDADLNAYSDAGTTPVTNGGTVQQWWNQVDNATYKLVMTTALNRPLYATGGPGGHAYITGDGLTDYLQGGGSNVSQPLTLYIVVNQVAWASTASIFHLSANTDVGAKIWQRTSTPRIKGFAGTDFTTGVDLTLATWGIVSVVFDGASSKIRLNDGMRTTIDLGTNGVNLGITAFNAPNGLSGSNTSLAAAYTYSAAHSDANNDSIVAGLKAKYAI